MKKLPLALLLLILSVVAAPRPAPAAPPTTLTYLGQLLVSGNAVSGSYDFQFSLWTASAGGTTDATLWLTDYMSSWQSWPCSA